MRAEGEGTGGHAPSRRRLRVSPLLRWPRNLRSFAVCLRHAAERNRNRPAEHCVEDTGPAGPAGPLRPDSAAVTPGATGPRDTNTAPAQAGIRG